MEFTHIRSTETSILRCAIEQNTLPVHLSDKNTKWIVLQKIRPKGGECKDQWIVKEIRMTQDELQAIYDICLGSNQ